MESLSGPWGIFAYFHVYFQFGFILSNILSREHRNQIWWLDIAKRNGRSLSESMTPAVPWDSTSSDLKLILS